MSAVPSNGSTPSPTLRLNSQGYSQSSLGDEVPHGFTPASSQSQDSDSRRTAHLFTPLEMNQQRLRLFRVLSNQGMLPVDEQQSQNSFYRQDSSPWQNEQPPVPESFPFQFVPQLSTQESNAAESPTKALERQNSQRLSQ